MAIKKQEINRKLFHLPALLLPAGIFYIPTVFDCSQFVPVILVGLLSITILAIEIARAGNPSFHRLFGGIFRHLLRDEESRKWTGSTWYIFASFICSLLFYKEPHIAFMALFLFLTGDAAAAIVGQLYGHIRIGNKSLEGSAGCFGICLIQCYFLFPILPLLLDTWNGRIPGTLIWITSLSVTLAELIRIGLPNGNEINDNLAGPVITGLTLKFLYPLFSGPLVSG